MPNTSDASATQVQHECYTNETSTTQVKTFDFDNDTSENIFLHHYISYVANEILQGEEQFHEELSFGNASFPYQNAFEKCITKAEHSNSKSYIKKLYFRL